MLMTSTRIFSYNSSNTLGQLLRTSVLLNDQKKVNDIDTT